jgi:hypothetical protein
MNGVLRKWFFITVVFFPLMHSLANIPVMEPDTIKPEQMRDYYLRNLPAIKEYQPWRISRYPYTPPRLAPGEGLVLVDLKGSGFITHVWWTGKWQREWIQFYFDGETTPSIEGLCSDLFADESVDGSISRLPVPLKRLPADGRNCYIPMPFHTSVKVVMVNRGEAPIEDTYFIFDGIFRSSKTVPGCTLKYSAENKQYFYSGQGGNEAIDPLRNEQTEIPFIGQSNTASNGIELMPGQEQEILTISGTAAVERLDIKADSLNTLQLRIKYEGSDAWAIDCPADKFFGQLNSLVLERSGNHSRCYLPMPFRKSCTVVLKNNGDSAANVSAEAVYRKMKSFPKNYTYLHARYHEGNGQEGQAYPLMEAAGKGHFVGMLLYHTTSPVKPTDHAGADMIYGDAQTDSPFVLRAIGGEDYFCAAFFGDNYATPHVGATPAYMEGGMRYRFHWESPIPFTELLNVDFSIFPGNGYQSVAFWYQDSPAPTPPAFRIPWLCIGPFSADSPQGDMLSMVFEPESRIIKDKKYTVELTTPARTVLKRTAQWRPRYSRGGFVDFNAENTQPFGYPPGVMGWAIDTISYAATSINSEQDQNVTLIVGHDDPVELILNGKSIAQLPRIAEFRTQEVQTQLAAGTNRLLVKSTNSVHPVTFIWDGFSLVIKDKHGKFMPDDSFKLD